MAARASIERNQKFSELCKLVCPGFLKRGNSGIIQMAQVLHNVLHRLDELYEQAQKFKKVHPNGIKVAEDIPVDSASASKHSAVEQYKKDAREFIFKYTEMDVPIDIAISRPFYAEIIKYCIKPK